MHVDTSCLIDLGAPASGSVLPLIDRELAGFWSAGLEPHQNATQYLQSFQRVQLLICCCFGICLERESLLLALCPTATVSSLPSDFVFVSPNRHFSWTQSVFVLLHHCIDGFLEKQEPTDQKREMTGIESIHIHRHTNNDKAGRWRRICTSAKRSHRRCRLHPGCILWATSHPSVVLVHYLFHAACDPMSSYAPACSVHPTCMRSCIFRHMRCAVREAACLFPLIALTGVLLDFYLN